MLDYQYYFLFWICVIGLCLGSFFNVVILRSLSNESIVFPPSKCPKCGNKLYFWHNIPVISYIILKGKCYFCKEKISIQYPLIEIITMLLFGFVYIKFGLSIKTLFLLFWISSLIIMTGTDIKEKLIDCNIAIAMGISGLLYNIIYFGKAGFLQSLLGILIGVAILESIARIGYLINKTRAMGEGDSYVAGALGAIFAKDIVIILFAGFIAYMLLILPVFFYRQYMENNKKVCILGILFILSILIFETLYQNYYTLLALLITGSWLSISILQNLKKQESGWYLPYLPALTIGTLYFIFFSI